MLVQCNSKCQTTVKALLDLETNDVVCTECGGTLDNVSKYSKLSMKTNGDVIRTKKKKAFVFHCETCDNHVETAFVNSVLRGKQCEESASCKINITKHMAKAIEETTKYLEKVAENDEQI